MDSKQQVQQIAEHYQTEEIRLISECRILWKRSQADTEALAAKVKELHEISTNFSAALKTAGIPRSTGYWLLDYSDCNGFERSKRKGKKVSSVGHPGIPYSKDLEDCRRAFRYLTGSNDSATVDTITEKLNQVVSGLFKTRNFTISVEELERTVKPRTYHYEAHGGGVTGVCRVKNAPRQPWQEPYPPDMAVHPDYKVVVPAVPNELEDIPF